MGGFRVFERVHADNSHTEWGGFGVTLTDSEPFSAGQLHKRFGEWMWRVMRMMETLVIVIV